MGIVQKVTRTPDYYKDIEYGKIGENDFEKNICKKIKDKGYSVFDVREEKKYQECDIDYIIDKKGGDLIPPFNEVITNERYQKIEVKLDSRGINTGNFPYELVSHSNSGWCVTTKCDYVYLVLTEKDGSEIKKRAWIDMNKWHEYCANRKNKKKLSFIKSENGIVDLLCNMDDMNNKGVLTWFYTKI